MEEVVAVVIVGAGPSGLATSACLTQHSIPHVILEREDCYASLWRKRTYDRLKLHLAKEFCSLPFKPHPNTSPTFMSKAAFLEYLDEYVCAFDIRPSYDRSVESATYDQAEKKWRIEAKNTVSGDVEAYVAEFLVVASGENSEGYIPQIPGLDSFMGEILHSGFYKSGVKYQSMDVLVVGCGNSGMEIAYDLSNYGAYTSIVVRSPFHVVNKEMVQFGMSSLKYLPVGLVDLLVTIWSWCLYGDLSKYGLHRPKKGPFYLKQITGRSPVIDVGTVKRIQENEIKVVPAISRISKNSVVFDNAMEREFDAIVFATGYKSLANNWLKDHKYVLNENGLPKNCFPKHWKGENGLYCAGLSRRGLFGVSMDAKAIADDIKEAYHKLNYN